MCGREAGEAKEPIGPVSGVPAFPDENCAIR
jgi:hypothetical protein